MLFRTETLVSFPRKKDRRRTQRQPGKDDKSCTTRERSEPCSKGPSLFRQKISIRNPLSEDWNNHFVPLALAGLRVYADMSLTMINAISNIISQNEHGSPLYKAFDAVGCAYLARTNPLKNALAHRIKAYREALTALNSTLCDSQKCRTNTTLLTVWVLGLYEVGSST